MLALLGIVVLSEWLLQTCQRFESQMLLQSHELIPIPTANTTPGSRAEAELAVYGSDLVTY